MAVETSRGADVDRFMAGVRALIRVAVANDGAPETRRPAKRGSKGARFAR